MALSVGDTFDSYGDLSRRIKAFEVKHHVQMVHNDSRTLEAAKFRAPKRIKKANSNLKYFSLDYTCFFGGKNYKAKGKGVRQHKSTFKQGCQASIKVRLSDDNQKLVVTDLNMEHNHAVSKEIFDHLPKQRKLDVIQKNEAKSLLKMKVNKKLLQQHLTKTSDKIVTLRDIGNIQNDLNASSDKNDLSALCTRLREIEGSVVEVFVSEDNTFTGLFFQDKGMKYAFQCYPELLMIDATYKLNELRMPLYLMLVVNGNGSSEIVSLFMTLSESRESIDKMVETFKIANPSWNRTGVIISDKDFNERAVFKEKFPDVSMHICLFHVLRSFRREVTCDKLGLRPGERDHVLEILTKLSYSKSDEEYHVNYQSLLDTKLQSVISYYNMNWHPIRQEWVEAYKSFSFTLGERTNNRLENINGKIKSVCSRYASLSRFFDHFFSLLSTLRNERNHEAIMALVKKPILSADIPEPQVVSMLTPYATNYICKQLSYRNKVCLSIEEESQSYIASSSEGNLLVSVNSCHCKFFNTMKLPCRHIFALREKERVPLLKIDDIADRWTMDYFNHVYNQKEERGTSTDSTTFCISSHNSTEPKKSVLSQHEKFRKAKTIIEQLPSLASEVGMDEFMKRINVLDTLKNIWARGGEAVVTEKISQQNNNYIETEDHHDLGEECLDALVQLLNEEDYGENLQTIDKENVLDSHASIQDTSSKRDEVSNIKLPPKIRKRGRPKGAELTVIGLTKKKKQDRTMPFLKKLPIEREKIILTWFVDKSIAEVATCRKHIIEEDEVEIRPEKVTAACLEPQVCLNVCKKYFSKDAWLVVEDVVDIIKKNPVWYCGRCSVQINDETDSSIQCDSCLLWFHFSCIGIHTQPKRKIWFCSYC